MIITPEYLRTNYTGAAESTDAVATQCLRAAIGDVEQIIGQPVEVREIEWYFTGNGRYDVTCPYTLGVTTDAMVLEYRPSLDDAWESVPDIIYERPVIRVPSGLLRGGAYRVTLDVGLADAVDPDPLSDAFTTDYRYEALRGVICEMAEAKFYASSGTNTGVKRSGVKQVTESTMSGANKTQVFIDPESRMDEWKRRLLPFKRLRQV